MVGLHHLALHDGVMSYLQVHDSLLDESFYSWCSRGFSLIDVLHQYGHVPAIELEGGESSRATYA